MLHVYTSMSLKYVFSSDHLLEFQTYKANYLQVFLQEHLIVTLGSNIQRKRYYSILPLINFHNLFSQLSICINLVYLPPWVKKIPWSRKWQLASASVFLPGYPMARGAWQGGTIPWGPEGSNTTEQLSTSQNTRNLKVIWDIFLSEHPHF